MLNRGPGRYFGRVGAVSWATGTWAWLAVVLDRTLGASTTHRGPGLGLWARLVVFLDWGLGAASRGPGFKLWARTYLPPNTPVPLLGLLVVLVHLKKTEGVS